VAMGEERHELTLSLWAGTEMRFVIGTIALLVLGSIFGSIAGVLFWPELTSATSVGSVPGVRPER
jgi:hypothetical protein